MSLTVPATAAFVSLRISARNAGGGTLRRTSTLDFPVTFTASDPSGVARAGVYLWHGSYNTPDDMATTAPTTCKPVTATTSACTAEVHIWDLRYTLATQRPRRRLEARGAVEAGLAELDYKAYASQPVALQWAKIKTSTWTTVKSVSGTTGGALKTTVVAGSDGSYRYSFAGTATANKLTSAADYVDVQ